MNEWLSFDFQPESSPFAPQGSWAETPPGELLAWVKTVLEDLRERATLSPADSARFRAALEALRGVDLSGLPTRFGYGDWDATPFEEALNELEGEEDLF